MDKPNSILTLGVLTYNRKIAAVANSTKLLERGVPQNSSYIVYDNASTDGTAEALTDLFSHHPNAHLSRDQTNRDYFGNFIRALRTAETPYIALASDEDEYIVDFMPEFTHYLENERPSFVSAPVLQHPSKGDGLHKGIRLHRHIEPREVRSATFYISGLVYNTADAQVYLPVIEANRSNEFVFVYPQVALTTLLMANRRKCEWYNKPLNRRSLLLPSAIRDSSGEKHSALDSRLRQSRHFDNFLETLILSALSSDEADVYKTVKKQNVVDLFLLINHALRMQLDQSQLATFEREETRQALRRIKNLIKAGSIRKLYQLLR